MELFESINKEFGLEFKSNSEVSFDYLVKYCILSEEFIEENFDELKKYVKTYNIFAHQCLSEEFIERHIEDVDWPNISAYQKLSEDFMLRHSMNLNWPAIFVSQKLSENFIEYLIENCPSCKYFLFEYISIYQKLSISFMEKYFDKLKIHSISKYQYLSEDFIEKHRNKLNHLYIEDNWIYKSSDEKKKAVIDTDLYECHDDYFIAYKGIRPDRYSLYNFQYKYEKGGIYESWCDCSFDCFSFGLNVATEEFAKNYIGCREGIVVKCKVRYEDVGRVVSLGDSIRCFKIEILD